VYRSLRHWDAPTICGLPHSTPAAHQPACLYFGLPAHQALEGCARGASDYTVHNMPRVRTRIDGGIVVKRPSSLTWVPDTHTRTGGCVSGHAHTRACGRARAHTKDHCRRCSQAKLNKCSEICNTTAVCTKIDSPTPCHTPYPVQRISNTLATHWQHISNTLATH
jgi:hypothetical protein